MSQIKVEPAVLELASLSGSQNSAFFRIAHTGNTPFRIKVTAERLMTGSRNKDADQPGLTVSPAEFFLNPADGKEIRVSFNSSVLPVNEEVYMVYFTVIQDPAEQTLGIITRYGHAVYVTAGESPDPLVRESGMDFFKSEQGEGYGFSVSVTNAGLTRIVPRGFLMITDHWQERRGYIRLNGKHPLFPGESGLYRGFWPGLHASGQYSGTFLLYYGRGGTGAQNSMIRREFDFQITEKGEIVKP